MTLGIPHNLFPPLWGYTRAILVFWPTFRCALFISFMTVECKGFYISESRNRFICHLCSALSMLMFSYWGTARAKVFHNRISKEKTGMFSIPALWQSRYKEPMQHHFGEYEGQGREIMEEDEKLFAFQRGHWRFWSEMRFYPWWNWNFLSLQWFRISF